MSEESTGCLKEDGTWKSRSDLRQIWKDVLGNDFDSPWSVMCGSGVTACHLVISAGSARWSARTTALCRVVERMGG